MGSACADTTQHATLEGNLLNHKHMTSIAYFHDYLSNYTVAHGSEYVLGETNSISVSSHLATSCIQVTRLTDSTPPSVSRPSKHLRRIRRRSMVNRLRPLHVYPPRLPPVLPWRNALPLFSMATHRHRRCPCSSQSFVLREFIHSYRIRGWE